MKTLSQLLENSYRNPGNGLGVTNHLTPVMNIVTNVRNLFAARLGAVVEEGEDHVSIKISCSRFITPNAVYEALTTTLYPGAYKGGNMLEYITSQGLTEVRLVNLGAEFVAYFCPNDIRSAKKPEEMEKATLANTQMKERRMEEAELETIKLVEGADDDTELEDKTYQELIELIKSDNKIKAAEKLSKLVSGEMELPKEYYFKAVKDADGEDSIALRYKYEKRRPHGKTIEVARSLMNIYGVGDEGVWVGEFEDKEKIADEVVTLIENILRLIGAKETDDPCVWSIPENPEKKDDNKDDGTKDDGTKDDGTKDDGTKTDDTGTKDDPENKNNPGATNQNLPGLDNK